jgi:antitoxin component YwqK of YwqJK toxin-antitoxin module
MKKFLLIIFFLPLLIRGQTSTLPTDSVLYLQYDTIIGKDTVWVYPYYFDNVHYQGLYIDSTIPDGQYHGYLNDSSTLLVKFRYQNYRPEGIVYYYRNGKIRSTYTYKNGEWNGPSTYYNDKGELDAIGNYKNGESDGLFYSYFDNGRISQKRLFIDGVVHGLVEYYYSNGNLNSIGSFDHGYHVGKHIDYYDNGKIREQSSYIDSIGKNEKQRIEEWKKKHMGEVPFFPVGTTTRYDKQGNKIEEYIYKDFMLVKSIKYHFNGKTKEEINYVDFHQGFCSQNPSYWIKGGQYVEYFDNGSKKTEGVYLNNQKEGEWFTWSDNGQLLKKEKYKNGKLKK